MRAVVQRVREARVDVDGRTVAEIGVGLLLLVGVAQADSPVDAAALARKVWTLRIMDGERSAEQLGAELLVVSQFTLYADTRKGRRPSWGDAAPGRLAEPLVDRFVTELRGLGARVATGTFGVDMQVALVNDGPVTILLET